MKKRKSKNESLRRFIIMDMVRVRRAAEWMQARRGRAAACVLWSVATPKGNGSKQPAQAHTEHRFAHARPYPRLPCCLSKRIFFCSLFFSFCVAKSAKPNECLLCTCWVWVHLPGTPRDTPRSRLLPRPAFSAASCPPAVRPPKSLPWPVQDCSRGRQRHVGRRGLDVWLQQNYETAPLSLSLSTCHRPP